MKVFIGWSGDRSEKLAHAVRDWIPLVLHYVEPWVSEVDIAAGERWPQALAKELEASNFGIICVTRENVTSPWILFEAGSLAKSLESSRVIPLLLDLEYSEISGPLAHFQAKKVDETGVAEVIQSINQAGEQQVPEARAQQLFEALWPQLEKQLASIPKQAQGGKPMRPQHEILEEVVAGVRSLDARLREVGEMVVSGERGAGRLRRHAHPMMLMELSHIISREPGDPIYLLLLASVFREELPWLYELALDAYRAGKAGPSEEADLALSRFLHAAEFVLEGPFPAEELGIDSRALHMTLRELQRFRSVEGLAHEERPKPRTTRRRPPDQR